MPPKFKRGLLEEEMESATTEEMEDLLLNKDEEDSDVELFPAKPTSVLSSTISPQTEDVKLTSIRSQIQEVTTTMQNNVHKILQRGERLEDLSDAAERLNSNSLEFSHAAARARRRAWLQQMKTRAIICIVVIIVILCVLVPILIRHSAPAASDSSSHNAEPTPNTSVTAKN